MFFVNNILWLGIETVLGIGRVFFKLFASVFSKDMISSAFMHCHIDIDLINVKMVGCEAFAWVTSKGLVKISPVAL